MAASLCWTRGDTAIIDAAVTVLKDGANAPFPLDPSTQVLRFTAKQQFTDGDAAAVISVSTVDSSIVITDGANGRCTITIQPGDYAGVAANPIAAGLLLQYDLQVAGSNGQNVHTVALGQLTLMPDVTISSP